MSLRHGKNPRNVRELSRMPCNCGKGFVLNMVCAMASDYDPFDEDVEYLSNKCPDNCEKLCEEPNSLIMRE